MGREVTISGKTVFKVSLKPVKATVLEYCSFLNNYFWFYG